MKKFVLPLILSVAVATIPFVVSTTFADPASNSRHHSKINAEARENDGKAIKLVMVIDKSEIKAAKVALQRSNNPIVRKFAHTMIKQHGQNLQETLALSAKIKTPAVSSAKSKMLQQHGQEVLKRLQSVKQEQFDLTYINAMIKGHTGALALIKTKLLPNANNPQLVKHLEATKGAVVRHLLMAKKAKHILMNNKM